MSATNAPVPIEPQLVARIGEITAALLALRSVLRNDNAPAALGRALSSVEQAVACVNRALAALAASTGGRLASLEALRSAAAPPPE